MTAHAAYSLIEVVILDLLANLFPGKSGAGFTMDANTHLTIGGRIELGKLVENSPECRRLIEKQRAPGRIIRNAGNILA